MIEKVIEIIKEIEQLNIDDKIEIINQIKQKLHEVSPFKNEPVDCVQWIKQDIVGANDYNPNIVAPPEMELLKLSIEADGFTQPIVSWYTENNYEVVDGFHRSKVGKTYDAVAERLFGYLPLVTINKEREERNNRIASTIRHNRARGKHKIEAMSDIVLELKNRNWKNARIAKELGMDEDEILRLCQITGLEELFEDSDFSKSWEIGSEEDEYQYLTDEIPQEEQLEFRTVNTNDPERIFHTYDKWECAKAGFYNTTVEGKTKEQCELEYAELLSNENEFRNALEGVITNWKHSCEHYLTNKAMNRIAWLGQASLSYARGIPSTFRGRFNLLTKEQQDKANEIAYEYLNKWMLKNNRKEVSFEDAISVGRQVEIY